MVDFGKMKKRGFAIVTDVADANAPAMFQSKYVPQPMMFLEPQSFRGPLGPHYKKHVIAGMPLLFHKDPKTKRITIMGMNKQPLAPFGWATYKNEASASKAIESYIKGRVYTKRAVGLLGGGTFGVMPYGPKIVYGVRRKLKR